ncbi:hypothetical protein MJO29_000645, partial [Puccinia striiformis f. sp. tritici]
VTSSVTTMGVRPPGYSATASSSPSSQSFSLLTPNVPAHVFLHRRDVSTSLACYLDFNVPTWFGPIIYPVTYQPNGDAIMETSENELTFKCLFRATDGHGIKFSTLVEPEETLVFQKSYSSVLRSGMIAKLKPKKKKVGKSAPATVVSLPKIVGPKRGPGVERRRRLIRRRSKILLKIRRRKVLKAAATTA